MGWLRAILRPGSTRMMTVLGTGRGRLYRIARVARWASVQGDIGGCYGSLIRERMGLPDRPLTRPVGSTGNWWLAQQAARKASAGERASILIGGVTICRHGARQNQPPSQVSQCEASLGGLAFTSPETVDVRGPGNLHRRFGTASKRRAGRVLASHQCQWRELSKPSHSSIRLCQQHSPPWPSTSGGGKARRAV